MSSTLSATGAMRCRCHSHSHFHGDAACPNAAVGEDGLCEQCHVANDAEVFARTATPGTAMPGKAAPNRALHGGLHPFGMVPFGYAGEPEEVAGYGQGGYGKGGRGLLDSGTPRETVELTGRATAMSSGQATITHGHIDIETPAQGQDVTVALTGVEAVGAVGNVGVEIATAISTANAAIKGAANITEESDTLTATATVSESAHVEATAEAVLITGFWGEDGKLLPGALDRAEQQIIALLELARLPAPPIGPGHNRPPGPFGDGDVETLETALCAIRVYRKALSQREPDPDVLDLLLAALRAAMSFMGRFGKWFLDGGKYYLKIVLDNASAEFGKSIVKPHVVGGWLALYTAIANGTSNDWQLLLQVLEKLAGH